MEDSEQSFSEESSSSSESDQELDVSAELQNPKFLQTLAKLKQGEAPDSVSESEDENDEEEAGKPSAKKSQKAVLLKDIAQDLVGGDEEDSEGEAELRHRSRTYNEDLEDTRQSLLQAATGDLEDDGDDEFFGEAKRKSAPSEGQKPAKKQKLEQGGMQDLLDQYFGKDEDLNKDDLFLKRFVSQQGHDSSDDEQPEEDLNEDENFLEAADRFEAEHNFRFEEAGADVMKTYPRQIEGVMRQEKSKRAKARQRKEERKRAERAQQEAEIHRMKSLKRSEIEEKLEEIRASSGTEKSNEELLALLESADFNEEEYDKIMEQAFGSDYYEAKEGDQEFQGEGYNNSDPENEDTGKNENGLSGTAAGGARTAQEVQNLLQEYNKLEYEDIISGMRTRFKYREVDQDDFGLSTADILSLSDKELNQVVGLRRLAPYREEYRSKKGQRDVMRKLKIVKQQQFAKPKGPWKEAEPAQDDVAKEDHRRMTFAKPELHANKPASIFPTASKKKTEKKEAEKEKEGTQISSPGVDTTGLTKAQKKNLKRGLKRKQKTAPAVAEG